MSIRQRIVLLVALVFVALGLIGGFAIVQARKNSEQVRGVTEGVVPSAIKSVELMTQLKDVQIAALAMLAAPDEDMVRKSLEELNAKKEGLQSALQEQFDLADNQAQRGLIQAAQESLQNYFASINDTAQFKLAGQTELAEANMGATVDQYLREQGQMIDAVQVEKRRSKDEAINALNAELSRTTLALTVISGVAVLALGGIGILLYRQVIHPIAQMESKMTEIATSQDFTHRLDIHRQDEIGRSMGAFNTMVEKIEESTALVKQKAADIHAMLHYVPQGILTVQPGGTVHPEYSEYLRTILETNDIAGRDVMALVFENTDLGEDMRSQIDAALHACLGEDGMNFEFNAHILPTEIHRSMPDGRVKILDLSWAPITSEDGTILRLLLCVRDVTELRSLSQAASAQRRELAIIGEILAVDADKLTEFFAGAQRYLTENERTVRDTDTTDAAATASAVGLLFRNMHTIKGNARTYGLQQLTDVVHRVEQHYDALRSGSAPWDTATLFADLGDVEQALDEYRHIHADKLGRKAALPGAETSAFLRMARAELDALLERLRTADTDSRDSLAAAVHHTTAVLQRLDTESLRSALSGVLGSLPDLAQQLGKESPHVDIEGDDIGIRLQAASALRDAFMHLLRNALDHGLEAPLARIARGKPAAGHIRMAVTHEAHHLRIALQDDGQGLDLARIRRKAMDRGLVDANAALSADEIAGLLFAPGFSTAEQVTDVSGRGVGMDAVRGLIEAQGGSIALQLLGAEGDATRHFQTIVTLPAHLAVASAAQKAVAA